MKKTYEVSYKYRWLIENPYWDTKEHKSTYTIKVDEDVDFLMNLRSEVYKDMISVPEIVNVNDNLFENTICGLDDNGNQLVVAYDIKATIIDLSGYGILYDTEGSTELWNLFKTMRFNTYQEAREYIDYIIEDIECINVYDHYKYYKDKYGVRVEYYRDKSEDSYDGYQSWTVVKLDENGECIDEYEDI